MASLIQSLKPYQRNLLASAIALVASVVILAFFYGVFLILKAFTTNFAGVLWPLATAGIVAMMLRPIVFWLERRLKFNRVLAIATIYFIAILALAISLVFILPVLSEQAVQFVQKMPVIWENSQAAFQKHFPAIEKLIAETIGEDRLATSKAALFEQLEGSLNYIPGAAMDVFSKVNSVLSMIAGLAIVPVYLFFFLKTDRDLGLDLDQQLSFLNQEFRSDIVFLVREFANSIEAFFRGQILIGLIIGVLLAIAFTSMGVYFGIGLGLFIGALNIIPYLGTIIGLSTVLPIAYFQPDGGLTLMLLALGAFFIVQLIEGYFLTPKIMGEKTGLHPLTIIIAIFFWGVALDGLLGMVLAIPLTAFFVVAWRLAKMKYLRYFSGEEIVRPEEEIPESEEEDTENPDLENPDSEEKID